MAIESTNDPGRSPRPSRTSPSRVRNGRAAPGTDPTNMPGQPENEVFGQRNPNTTGAPGSRGASRGGPDVTMYDGQLEQSFTGLKGAQVTSTGAPGSQGASPRGGGETVTYTDTFAHLSPGYLGSSTTGQIGGEGDWTQFGEANGFSGRTLPILENNRPTTTGAGQGHVRTHRKG
jgi:hypothetical protein